MNMSVEEAGRRGGIRNSEKFNKQHFINIGRIGGLRTKSLYADKYSQWGKKGGRPRKVNLGERS